MLLAQEINVGGSEIKGPLDLGKDALGKDIPITVGNLVSIILTKFVLPIASVILLFVIIWAGYSLLISRGEPEKIKAARAKITYGILGFVLLALSYFIINVISYIFGIGRELF